MPPKLIVLIHIICGLIFLGQLRCLMNNYLEPQDLNTVLENKHLNKTNISLVFKVCYKPAFNKSVFKSFGYVSAERYFLGQPTYGTKDFIGWRGKTRNTNASSK